MAKYFLIIIAFIYSGYTWADEVPSELAGVFKYLNQDFGSKTFYGFSASKSLSSGVYIGAEMMFPAETKHFPPFHNGTMIKEHGGLYVAFRTSINRNMNYQVALLGGIAMAEYAESYGDASGVCDCTYGFIEPTFRILYNLSPYANVGVIIGIFKISTDSNLIPVSGVGVALKF